MAPPRGILALAAPLAATLFGVAAAHADTPPADSLPLETTTSPPPEHRADPSLRTYVFRLGPRTIGPYGVVRRNEPVEPPPVHGSIVAMDTRVVDPSGQEIPQSVLMLHHIVFTNGGADGSLRDAACPERPVNQRFFGTSEELRALTLPRGYGYPTGVDHRWRTIWMIMNHTHHIRRAYLEYRVTVDPSPDLEPVTPYWLSVLPCRRSPDPQYTVPGGGRRGSTHVLSRDWTLPAGGKIVAIGGHLHGGGRGLAVSQPGCGDRRLFAARPTYGLPDDPLYRIRPLLHEPDPKNVAWFQSATGWPVQSGERVRVTSIYDAERPHMRVMGIGHVYVAHGPPGPSGCAAAPPDAEILGPSFAGRRFPPRVRLTLASFDGSGRARPMRRPPGRWRVLRRGARVRVRRSRFRPPNLSVPLGATVRWRFGDRVRHDATLVAGPRGFASPTVGRGGRFGRRFRVPGLYRLHCSTHPVTMSQAIRVRRR